MESEGLDSLIMEEEEEEEPEKQDPREEPVLTGWITGVARVGVIMEGFLRVERWVGASSVTSSTLMELTEEEGEGSILRSVPLPRGMTKAEARRMDGERGSMVMGT